jgi:hypothetical protein
MLEAAVVYTGLVVMLAGLVLAVRPIRRLGIATRPRGLAVAATGVLVACIGMLLPARESRIARPATRLDAFAPAWQFHEVHTRRIAAPAPRVYEAITRVRADEIALFRTLTWIRRGGRPQPPGILSAGRRESLIDVATHNGFVRLADEAPRELVIGTVVAAPPGARGQLTPEVFQRALPPGYALATMNFLVSAAGPDSSVVTTETRVYATSPAARRRFAAYWRVIYPGSALIRRMWLRAVARRATGPADK